MNALTVAECFDYPPNPDEGKKLINEAREKGQLDLLIHDLIRLSADKSPNVRVGAIEALGDIEEADTDEVIGALIAKLPDGEQRNFCSGGAYADEDDMRTPGQVAAQVLGRKKARGAVQPLIEIISFGSDFRIWNRVAAIEALGEIGEPSALVILNEVCSSQEEAAWGVYSEGRQVSLGKLAQAMVCKIKRKMAKS